MGFQMAAEFECPTKKKLAIKSVMCLLCGKVMCIDCCARSVVDHCKECNGGLGVFLYLQRSSIILTWDTRALEYEPVYLDQYGETDCGLSRGVQLRINRQRYEQLTQLVVQHMIPNKLTQHRVRNSDILERRLRL